MYDCCMSSLSLGREELSLKYQGSAFDSHSINAKALASSLLSFSDAVSVATKTIDKDLKVELQVTAQREGSFDVVFLLQQGLQSIGEFSDTAVGKGVSFLSTVGLSGLIVGAIKLVVAKINSGEPTVEEVVDQDSDDLLFSDERVVAVFPDGRRVETSRTQLRISELSDFVNKIGDACSVPVDDGFDGVEFSSSAECVDVSVRDAQGMREYVPVDEVISEAVSDYVVQPLSVNFEDHKAWKLTTDNSGVISAEMTDEGFYQRLEEGLRVGKRDVFKVRMHVVSARDKRGKLKAKYTILRVLDYIPYNPPFQGSLFD